MGVAIHRIDYLPFFNSTIVYTLVQIMVWCDFFIKGYDLHDFPLYLVRQKCPLRKPNSTLHTVNNHGNKIYKMCKLNLVVFDVHFSWYHSFFVNNKSTK